MSQLSLLCNTVPIDGDPRQQWATPLGLFKELHQRFGFTVDACALDWNHKLDRYWTPEDDGLTQPWAGERVWCNPPYDDISPWVARGPEAHLAVYLLPARTDQRWFHRALDAGARVEFIKGRVSFVPPPGIDESSNREPSLLVIFGR